MNASTFTARVVASTGADVAAALSAAVGALSGPLHGGAPSRVLQMLDEVDAAGDAERWVKDALDRGERLMGFGHRVYRAEDPRARVLRRTAREIGAPRLEVAEKLEEAALAELAARKPDRVLATNVEFWSAVVLDFAGRPARPVHPDVLLRARGRLVGAHHGAEARGPADPPERAVRRAGAALGRLGQRRRAVVGAAMTSAEKRLVLVAAILGTTVVTVDSTVVNVALPAIADDLGGGLAGQQWTSNAYLVTLSSLLLIGGSLGDLFGERRMFVARGRRLRRDLAAVRARADDRAAGRRPGRSRASPARS